MNLQKNDDGTWSEAKPCESSQKITREKLNKFYGGGLAVFGLLCFAVWMIIAIVTGKDIYILNIIATASICAHINYEFHRRNGGI